MTKMFADILGSLLKFVYDFVSGIGLDFTHLSAYAIAVILTTIIFKFMLLPLTLKQLKSMKKMQDIQPKIKELQKKYKNDKETLNVKTMELYKEHNANPFGSCLPIIIQFPVIIGFFNALRSPATYVFKSQAAFEAITNRSFFWIKDIGYTANYIGQGLHEVEVDGVTEMINDGLAVGQLNGLGMGGLELPFIGTAVPVLAILAALTTYLSSKSMSNRNSNTVVNEQAQTTQKTMTMMMPVMIFVFGLSMPAGLTLYWTMGNLFQVAQQYFINRSVGKVKGASN